MATTSLLALIDDIATLLDDVSLMTKVAATKTAGVLGDDLALNAQQVAGVDADRELPVVWAVAKGSALNKLILVPLALAISSLAPWAVTPLLMVGGAFLCYEGFEKLAHKFLHVDPKEDVRASTPPADVDPAAFERDKVKGAIRTDFVLSAEIIAITLGVVAGESLVKQVVVLSGIAVIMTVGVYGVVAAIVKLDDAGLWLNRRDSSLAQAAGRGILAAAPWLMKALSVAGTAAMFLVGGGIITHGIPALHHAIEAFTSHLAAGGIGWPSSVLPSLVDALLGILVGALCLAVTGLAARLIGRRAAVV